MLPFLPPPPSPASCPRTTEPGPRAHSNWWQDTGRRGGVPLIRAWGRPRKGGCPCPSSPQLPALGSAAPAQHQQPPSSLLARGGSVHEGAVDELFMGQVTSFIQPDFPPCHSKRRAPATGARYRAGAEGPSLGDGTGTALLPVGLKDPVPAPKRLFPHFYIIIIEGIACLLTTCPMRTGSRCPGWCWHGCEQGVARGHRGPRCHLHPRRGVSVPAGGKSHPSNPITLTTPARRAAPGENWRESEIYI